MRVKVVVNVKLKSASLTCVPEWTSCPCCCFARRSVPGKCCRRWESLRSWEWESILERRRGSRAPECPSQTSRPDKPGWRTAWACQPVIDSDWQWKDWRSAQSSVVGLCSAECHCCREWECTGQSNHRTRDCGSILRHQQMLDQVFTLMLKSSYPFGEHQTSHSMLDSRAFQCQSWGFQKSSSVRSHPFQCPLEREVPDCWSACSWGQCSVPASDDSYCSAGHHDRLADGVLPWFLVEFFVVKTKIQCISERKISNYQRALTTSFEWRTRNQILNCCCSPHFRFLRLSSPLWSFCLVSFFGSSLRGIRNDRRARVAVNKWHQSVRVENQCQITGFVCLCARIDHYRVLAMVLSIVT